MYSKEGKVEKKPLKHKKKRLKRTSKPKKRRKKGEEGQIKSSISWSAMTQNVYTVYYVGPRLQT